MRRLCTWLSLMLLAAVGLGCSIMQGVTPTPTAPLLPATLTPLPPVTLTPLPPATLTPLAPATSTPVPAVTGAQYYVDSATGSDENSGTSPDTPWQTLARLMQQRLSPGDAVNLARGSTYDGGLIINASGAEGNPIYFRAYGSGAKPVLTNAGQWSRCITINGSWVVVEGVMLREAQEFGVRISEFASHNVVRDVEAAGVGIGVGIYGQHNLVTSSYFHDLKLVVNTPGGDDDYGAYAIGLYGSNNEIAHNRMERCKAPSYDYGQDGGVIEVYGHVAGNYIHHNWASDCSGFLEVGGGSAQDNVLAHNVSVNNGSFSVVHLDGRFANAVTHLYLDNNTIVETGSGKLILDFVGQPTPETLFLRNNVIYVGSYRQVAGSSSFTHTNNLYCLKQWQTQLGFKLGPGEKMGDPLFVDLKGQDFHLQPNSPAANGGAELSYDKGFPAPPTPDHLSLHIGALPPVGG